MKRIVISVCFSILLVLLNSMGPLAAQGQQQSNTALPAVSRETFDRWMQETSNAGRWGANDELGTLNLITPEKRRRAAQSVRDGIAVSLAHEIVAGPDLNTGAPMGLRQKILVWLTDSKLNGAGALFDFGCYGADLTTWLMDGRRPDAVTAVTQRIKPEVYPRVDDEATIVLTYPKAQAILQASWNWPFDRKDMEVYGQTGYVITVGRDDVRVRREARWS